MPMLPTYKDSTGHVWHVLRYRVSVTIPSDVIAFQDVYLITKRAQVAWEKRYDPTLHEDRWSVRHTTAKNLSIFPTEPPDDLLLTLRDHYFTNHPKPSVPSSVL